MSQTEQADRFWAKELGVDPAVLRSGGFHVIERIDADPQPRAITVATRQSTVVSLVNADAGRFEIAGLILEDLQRSPLRYLASCTSSPSLNVRRPAYLAYWSGSAPPAPARGEVAEFSGADFASLASLQAASPEEWAEAGVGPESRVFGQSLGDQVVAVAAYDRWPGQLAQVRVFCHPRYRRRGLAAEALKAAVRGALAQGLLPQYRARHQNRASLALAERSGFLEYGWMATVRIFSREIQQ